MSSKHTHPINLETIFGKTRRTDKTRLLGVSPEDTFTRIKAHSVRGCCLRHDQDRKPEVVCGE